MHPHPDPNPHPNPTPTPTPTPNPHPNPTLHQSEPSYGFSSREFLDAIATLVLLPAIPAFYRHVAPVFGIGVTNFLTQAGSPYPQPEPDP